MTDFLILQLFSRLHIQNMSLSLEGCRQNKIEQNRCAMACQGCGSVFSFLKLKSSGNQVLIVVLLSHHNQQSNRIDITTAYEKINT